MSFGASELKKTKVCLQRSRSARLSSAFLSGRAPLSELGHRKRRPAMASKLCTAAGRPAEAHLSSGARSGRPESFGAQVELVRRVSVAVWLSLSPDEQRMRMELDDTERLCFARGHETVTQSQGGLHLDASRAKPRAKRQTDGAPNSHSHSNSHSAGWLHLAPKRIGKADGRAREINNRTVRTHSALLLALSLWLVIQIAHANTTSALSSGRSDALGLNWPAPTNSNYYGGGGGFSLGAGEQNNNANMNKILAQISAAKEAQLSPLEPATPTPTPTPAANQLMGDTGAQRIRSSPIGKRYEARGSGGRSGQLMHDELMNFARRQQQATPSAFAAPANAYAIFAISKISNSSTATDTQPSRHLHMTPRASNSNSSSSSSSDEPNLFPQVAANPLHRPRALPAQPYRAASTSSTVNPIGAPLANYGQNLSPAYPFTHTLPDRLEPQSQSQPQNQPQPQQTPADEEDDYNDYGSYVIYDNNNAQNYSQITTTGSNESLEADGSDKKTASAPFQVIFYAAMPPYKSTKSPVSIPLKLDTYYNSSLSHSRSAWPQIRSTSNESLESLPLAQAVHYPPSNSHLTDTKLAQEISSHSNNAQSSHSQIKSDQRDTTNWRARRHKLDPSHLAMAKLTQQDDISSKRDQPPERYTSNSRKVSSDSNLSRPSEELEQDDVKWLNKMNERAFQPSSSSLSSSSSSSSDNVVGYENNDAGCGSDQTRLRQLDSGQLFASASSKALLFLRSTSSSLSSLEAPPVDYRVESNEQEFVVSNQGGGEDESSSPLSHMRLNRLVDAQVDELGSGEPSSSLPSNTLTSPHTSLNSHHEQTNNLSLEEAEKKRAEGEDVGEDVGEAHNVYLWRLLFLVLPLGATFGNTLVIIAVFVERSLQSVTNYFIVSLAVADLFVGLIVMPFAVYVLVNDQWELGDRICDIYVAVDVTSSTASIINLVAISVDRYRAVAHPISYSARSSSTRAKLTIVAVWLISCSVGAPIVLGINTSPERIGSLCIFYNSDFIFWSTIISFVLPAFIMIILYWHIFSAIRKRTKKALQVCAPAARSSKRQLFGLQPPNQLQVAQVDEAPRNRLQPAIRMEAALAPPRADAGRSQSALEPLEGAAAPFPAQAQPETSREAAPAESPLDPAHTCPLAAHLLASGPLAAAAKPARAQLGAANETDQSSADQVSLALRPLAWCQCGPNELESQRCQSRFMGSLARCADFEQHHKNHLSRASSSASLSLALLLQASDSIKSASPLTFHVVSGESAPEVQPLRVRVNSACERPSGSPDVRLELLASTRRQLDLLHLRQQPLGATDLLLKAECQRQPSQQREEAPASATCCSCCRSAPAVQPQEAPASSICLLEPLKAEEYRLTVMMVEERSLKMAQLAIEADRPLTCGAFLWLSSAQSSKLDDSSRLRLIEATNKAALCRDCQATCLLCAINKPFGGLAPNSHSHSKKHQSMSKAPIKPCKRAKKQRQAQCLHLARLLREEKRAAELELGQTNINEPQSDYHRQVEADLNGLAGGSVSDELSASEQDDDNSSMSSISSSSSSASTNFHIGSSSAGSSITTNFDCSFVQQPESLNTTQSHSLKPAIKRTARCCQSTRLTCSTCELTLMPCSNAQRQPINNALSLSCVNSTQESPTIDGATGSLCKCPQDATQRADKIEINDEASEQTEIEKAKAALISEVSLRLEAPICVVNSERAASNQQTFGVIQNATEKIKRRSIRLGKFIRGCQSLKACPEPKVIAIQGSSSHTMSDETSALSSSILAGANMNRKSSSGQQSSGSNLQPVSLFEESAAIPDFNSNTLTIPSTMQRASLTDAISTNHSFNYSYKSKGNKSITNQSSYIINDASANHLDHSNKIRPSLFASVINIIHRRQYEQTSTIGSTTNCKQDPITRENLAIVNRHRGGSRRRREKNAARRERKATKTLAIVLCVFLICWTPFFTCNIIDGICIKFELSCRPTMTVYIAVTWLGYINSCINPIIYTIFNMEFRRAFKKILTSSSTCCKG